MDNSWVKLNRKIIKWEWYTISEMVHLFFHLIASANYKDTRWKGIEVKRGQLITGREKLSKETGISERKIRTCLDRLQSSGELTITTTNRFSIITICNYDKYQMPETEGDQPNANKRPTSDQQATTSKKEKNINNLKNNLNPKGFDVCTDVLNQYHLLCPSLPKVKILNESRKKKIRTRLKETNIDVLKKVFRAAEASSFLKGKNDRKWRADFDWLMANDKNWVKVKEGKYDDKKEVGIEKARFNTKLLDKVIDAFVSVHGDYTVTDREKERKAAEAILKIQQEQYPADEDEQLIEGLKAYFEHCVNIDDAWYRPRMSLPLIASHFNQIKQIIKHGTHRKNNEGASPDELGAFLEWKLNLQKAQ